MPARFRTDPATTPVVVACCRTAIGEAHRSRGVFRRVRGDELAAAVVEQAVARSGIDPATIDDVVVGATRQRGEQAGNLGRIAGLMAGLPPTAAGTTVNRLCGSSLQALAQACHAIAAGAENVQVVAGVEHMLHLPPDDAGEIHPRALARSSPGTLSLGLTVERLATSGGISRRRQEEFALASHQRAARAHADGLFAGEIVPIVGHDEAAAVVEVWVDQSVRPDASLEAMAELEPSVLPGTGTITAATSAPAGDGAAALVVMSAAEAARQGVEPMARVAATAVAGVPPAVPGTGPVVAIRKLLARAAARGIAAGDIDLFELSEVFAAQAIHCIDALGLDPARVNVRGGSLALGHPPGASGARLATTLLHAMRDRDARLGLATTCIGMGQGIAVLFERAEPGP